MKSNVWRGVTAILVFALCAVIFLSSVLIANEKSINSFFGISGGTTTSSGTTTFYESEYGELNETNLQKLIEDDMAFCMQETEEGSVLLTNNGALPLASNIKKISLFGRASADIVYRGSAGGPSVDSSRLIDLKTAFTNAGFEINQTLYNAYANSSTSRNVSTGSTADIGEEDISFYTSDIRSTFSSYNDAAIVVLSRYGGESVDLSTSDVDGVAMLSLHESEKDMLEMVKNNFSTIIVIINSVYAIDIGWLDDYDVDACLWIGNPGYYGLTGVVNILTGEANPSGKLVDTYATNSLSSAAMQNFGTYQYTNSSNLDTWSKNYVVYEEGIYVGYKYYETRYEDCVLGQGNADGSAGVYESSNNSWNYAEEMGYPFGYGLSYTTFTQTLDSVEYNAADDTFTATVTVKNVGDVAGKDVVEIYVQLPYTEYDKTNGIEKASIQLLAYDKTETLDPDASQTLEITFDRYLMATWDSTAYNGDGSYILDDGTYYFAIGNGAHEALNNVLAQKAKDNGATYELYDHNGDSVTGNTDCVAAYKLNEFDNTTYKTSQYTDEEVSNQFSDADPNYYGESVTYLTRSDWQATFPTAASLTANSSMQTAMTASSYTTSSTAKSVSDCTYGQDNGLTLYDLIGKDYDDPDWTKLVQQMTLKELSVITVTNFGSGSISSIGRPATYESEGPEGCRGTYLDTNQNATGYAGLPVLAATWNHDLQLRYGELVGENCLYCGVDLINGPGANIHRTPYGGRASEYYSEDGILTYYAAANTVEGLQNKHVLANIKHFALNDQEAGRQGIATWANEQSIREIYLKAFEKSFTDGNLYACMTSYNRIGVTYNGANYALITEVVREEWGFIGYMNIDYLTESTYSVAVDCFMAGTDVVMGNSDRSSTIAKALSKDGDLIEVVQESAHRILYAFSQSRIANTLSTTGEVADFTAWWVNALIALEVVVSVITVASFCMYVFTTYFYKGKKKEAKK